ncbi:MAG: T9SS C-terminal target domain-containing protein [Cryomorphaceae bacterium]|nr:MAG: T9SS C-terminal target domain-containing protein [Cryomorphaceae bacterium]
MFIRLGLIGLLMIAGMTRALAQHPILDDFSVFQHHDQVYLSWVISRGNTCNGITIERSTDGAGFSEIGYIAGICGSPDFAQPFSFIDTNPAKNQINYYRLELGLQGYTEVRSVEFIHAPDDGFILRPNPASYMVQMLFRNPRSQEHVVELYNLSGALVLQHNTLDQQVELDISRVPAGVYLLRLTSTSGQHSSTRRLVIAR